MKPAVDIFSPKSGKDLWKSVNPTFKAFLRQIYIILLSQNQIKMKLFVIAALALGMAQSLQVTSTETHEGVPLVGAGGLCNNNGDCSYGYTCQSAGSAKACVPWRFKMISHYHLFPKNLLKCPFLLKFVVKKHLSKSLISSQFKLKIIFWFFSSSSNWHKKKKPKQL